MGKFTEYKLKRQADTNSATKYRQFREREIENQASQYIVEQLKNYENSNSKFVQSYNDRFFDSDGKYISDKYRRNTQVELLFANKEKERLEKQRQELISLLDSYGSNFKEDWLQETQNYLNEAGNVYDKIIKTYSDDNDLFSGFKNADEFYDWSEKQKQKETLRNTNLNSVKTEISDLTNALNNILSIEGQKSLLANQYDNLMYSSNQYPSADGQTELNAIKAELDAFDKKQKELEGVFGSSSDIKKKLEELNKTYSSAKELQETEALTTDALNASDFEKFAQKGSEWGNDTNFEFYGKDEGRGTYGFFNREKNDLISYYRNNLSSYEDEAKHMANGPTKEMEKAYHFAKEMTEDEYNIYAYYLGKGDTDSAKKYLDSIEQSITYRFAENFYDKNLKDANYLEQIVFALTAGTEQFQTGLENLFSDSSEFAPSYRQVASEKVREDLKDKSFNVWYNFKTGEWEDKINGSSIGQIGYDLASTTGNMLPSILTSAAVSFINPTAGQMVGSALMGASAKGNAYAEMINLGYNPEQASRYSTLVGASEAGLQFLLGGIGKLGGSASSKAISTAVSKIDNVFARTAIQLGGNMLSEGTEEYLQEVLDPFFKNIAFGEDNDIRFISEDALYSGLLGALSAGVLEGGSTVGGNVSTYRTGKQLKAAGVTAKQLSELGSKLSVNSEAYKLAGRINENTGAYTIGRMFNALNAEITAQNKAEIKEALRAKGINPISANSIANWMERVVAGEELTAKQKAALENNPVLGEVMRDVLYERNTTALQRQAGLDSIRSQLEEYQIKQALDKAVKKAEKKKAKNAANNKADTQDTQNTAQQAETEDFEAETDTSLAESEKANEANPRVSDNGRTFSTKTGEDLDIVGIASVKDKTFKTADGQTVDSKDVSFATENEAVLYDSVLSMDLPTEIANAIIDGYIPSDNISVTDYLLGSNLAYRYGYAGAKDIELMLDSDVRNIPEHLSKGLYNLGRETAKAEISKEQAKIDEKKAQKSENKAKKKGRVTFDGKELSKEFEDSLTDIQRESIKGIKIIAEVLGNDVNLFASYIAKEGPYKGKRVYKDASGNIKLAPNGFYNPDGSINLDINSGNLGEGTMLYTLSHELTHHIRKWSPAKFKVLADFVVEQYSDNGIKINDLVYEQMAKAKKNGRSIRYGTAYEEVVADACSTMLLDSNAIEKLAQKDKTLFEKIKSFIKDFIDKINKLHKNFSPDAKEAQYVKDIKGMTDKLQALWFEGLEDASSNYTASDSSQENESGEIKYSYSSIAYSFFGDENVKIEDFENGSFTETEGYKQYVLSCLNNMRQTIGRDFNEAESRKEIEDSIKGIVKVAVAMKKAGYDILDNHEKRGAKDSKQRLLFSSLEPNSDYFTSSDISTICDKRINFASIYDEIVRREAKLGVPKGKRFFDNVDNYFVLHKIMADKGLTQPCRQCYVESMRKNLAPMANAFLKLMQETDPNNKANDQLFHVIGKQKGEIKSNNAELRTKLLEAITSEEYDITADKLTVEMLTTEDGLTQLKLQAPLIYEAFNSFYGQSKPKMPKAATPFRFGELTAMLTDNNGKIKTGLIKKIMSTGGFRLQSYSDFQIQNFADVLQVIFEAGTLGLNGHAYTKVPAFLDATKGTNLKRNISIFMYNDGGKWLIDKNDSFPYDLDEIYEIVNSDKQGNTSIIAVTQNEMMAAWVMANENIGYFIPFHKSGLKMGTVRDTIVKEGGREIKGYSGIKDHTRQQTEVWAKTTSDHKADTKVKKGINIYEFWDFDNAENLPKNKLIEKNVKAYIDACNRAGYLPKFREYVMNNSKVLNSVLNYSKELGFVTQDATIDDISFEYKGYRIPYGYYKCLGDFGMFTPDGKASPIKRLSLKDYNFDEAEKFFSDAESLRRTEILQQIANGSERLRYLIGDKKNMTTAEIAEEVQTKRNKVVEEVVSGEYKNTKYSDRDSLGNELSAEQQEYFKDSKVRDENGNLLVVRHGTNAEFNIFDFDKAGKNGKLEGYGFYFSDDSEITERYGSIQMEEYLNITKPLYKNKKTISKAECIKLTNALIDFNIKKYGDENLIWQDSFISNYVMTYNKPRVSAVREFVNQIWEYNETDQDIVLEIAAGDGRMYDSASMQEFYDVLTKSVGYDGIIAEWEHDEGVSNVFVTFKSNQSKNITNTTPTSDPDIRYSGRDSTYMEAVNNGDMDTAQKMVEKAAREAGYTVKVYHGTPNFGFTKLNVKKSDDGISFFATEDITVGSSYAGAIASEKRSISEKKSQLSKRAVPKLRNQIKVISLEFLHEYTETLGHYDSWYMDSVEYITNRDTSEVVSPEELIEYATLAIDTISAANLNTISEKRKGRQNSSPILTEETKQKLTEVTLKYAQKLSEVISPYQKSGVYGLYANTDNHLVVDAQGSRWNDIKSNVLPSIKEAWTTRDVALYAKENGYSGVTFKNIVDPANHTASHPATVYAFFNPKNQLKSADTVTYDMFGKVIPLSKRFDTTNKDIRYSDRNPDGGFSKRYLLANALESTAKTAEDKKKLVEYKAKLGKLSEVQQRLQDVNAKIKEISFGKGKRDKVKLAELQKTSKELNDLINRYDKKLFNLESTESLKQVLEREKKAAYKKAAQEGKEALTDYREKAKQREQDIRTKYQESRQKSIEGREKTAMRHKIQKVIMELDGMLRHGTKEKNVKVGLQKVVADAVQAINADTVKLEALRKAYADIRYGKSENVPAYYMKEAAQIEQKIDEVIDLVGDTPMSKMSLEQLDSVYDMYRMVLTTVRNVNKVFRENKLEDLRVNAEAVMVEESRLPKLKEERLKAIETVRKYMWNEMIPPYAFETLGSNTLKKFFWDTVEAQNVFARDVDEANAVAKNARKKYGYKTWDRSKIYEFTLEDGKVFRMNLEHMMSVYAYSKRKQAISHMTTGGFFFNDDATFRKKGGVISLISSQEEGYKVSAETLAKIKDKMSEVAKGSIEYVDEMQSYLTDMGEKGNEVSRVIWGIDIFKEKVYFPLKSVKDFVFQTNQPTQETSLKNDGMTKETKPNASNPIVLDSFDDIWASHVNRMSQYHAFVIPIDNLNKVYNYGTWLGDSSKSVSTIIGSRHGKAANEYLTQFIQDLNGGISVKGASNPLMNMFGKFKKTAVAASTSVVVQQPTAILRATAMIDPKYFVGKPNVHMLKQYEQLKKYAPIAIIKEIGGFDAGAGRQATNWLNDDTKQGIDKALQKIDDISMLGAAWGDILGWCTIWDAVKREVKANNKGTDVNSEEFLNLAGKRFTEVIVYTQVYDSTLSRSGYMRSKHDSVKMLTAFMGEPTVSVNMMYNAVLQAKRGGKGTVRKAARTIGAVYLSTIAASAAASAIYALRDDDEDETYLEKFAEAWSDKMLGKYGLTGELNPLTQLPAVKDIISIFEGWDVERTDIAVIKDIKDAFDGLFSDNKSTWRKIEDFSGAIASLFGLPVKNILRTGREMYNAVNAIFSDVEGGSFGEAFVRGMTGEKKSKPNKLYDAIVNGDEEMLKILREGYDDDSAYETAVKKALRENDPRIKQAAQAGYDGDVAERVRIAKEIIAEGNFSQDIVVEAINAEVNAIKKKLDPEEDETEDAEEKKSVYSTKDISIALEEGDAALAKEIIADIVSVKVENYMAKDENLKQKEAEKKAKTSVKSSLSEYWKKLYVEAYNAKDTDEMKRIRFLLKDTGLYGTANDIISTCNNWVKESRKK